MEDDISHIICDSQDLTLHTTLSDAVAAVRQTLSVRDFECDGVYTKLPASFPTAKAIQYVVPVTRLCEVRH
jgi:hypothetical protein